MKNVSTLIDTYRYLLKILLKNAPAIVILVFGLSILFGLLAPFGVFVNSNLFNLGLKVAQGEVGFGELIPFLVLFVVAALAPGLIDLFVDGFAEARSQLVLRSAFRGEMLQKLKKMKYEHLENEVSMEIIDKAYSRAENAARHLFPMYVFYSISSVVGAMGSLYIIVSIKWWLIIPILIPFILETILASRSTFNIYVELESYWKQEKEYAILQNILQERDYIRENWLNQASDYLVETYKSRLKSRNRTYEKYFFKNLRKVFLSSNISRFAVLGNILLLLFIYIRGEVSVGLFISASLMIFNSLYNQLGGSVFIFKWGHYHANFFNYYRRYFELSDDIEGEAASMPERFDIEFRDVWFRYPGTDRDILKGISFVINDGEKVSIVGENGEGKSTMVKLLLGLFAPDRGEILVGGKPLARFSLEQRIRLFGTVFQDFSRFNITLEENVVIGDLSGTGTKAKDRFESALKRAGLEEVVESLPEQEKALLGKQFEGGTDLSGGQWQRIAMARALYGNRPILILDEPTSQLDPMAESALYREFAEITHDKTSLFITHRLGSTAVTDQIIVISDGVVAEVGTHEELIEADGLYAEMFESQKSWYDRSGSGREAS
jgi:ATP-binding cassette subfamily B protein